MATLCDHQQQQQQNEHDATQSQQNHGQLTNEVANNPKDPMIPLSCLETLKSKIICK